MLIIEGRAYILCPDGATMGERLNYYAKSVKTHRTAIYKTVVSVAVLAYVFAVGVYLFPESPARTKLVAPMRGVIDYAGLWQSYVVFSPNPRTINVDVTAEISFSDGSMVTWHYPRMDQLNQIERIVKERYRKYGLEHLNNDKEAMLRKDFARYLARQYKAEDKLPTQVKLIRHWAGIPAPALGMGKPLPPHLNHFTFYTYSVKPSDLV
jgi:hypothetical protein